MSSTTAHTFFNFSPVPGRKGIAAIAMRRRMRYFVRMKKVNLDQALASFSEHWQPRIVGELNGQHVKVAKLLGEFVWHHHEHEDELFLVVRGAFTMELRDRSIELREGDFFIVPRGVEHRPVAKEEVHVLLFEPATTLNTGNVLNERTFEAVAL